MFRTRNDLTLEGWGYTNEAYRRRLVEFKPTKVGFVGITSGFSLKATKLGYCFLKAQLPRFRGNVPQLMNYPLLLKEFNHC